MVPMPHKIAVDETVNCFFVRWTGVVKAGELRSFFFNIARLPWFRPGLNCLTDMRQADFRVSQSEAWAVADMRRLVGEMFGTGRVACVVGDQRTHNLVCAFDAVTSSPERPSDIFRDSETAKAWLGLPADYVGPFDDSE